MSFEQVGTPEIAAREAIDAVAAGGYLLDVREQYEWDAGHAPDAHLVPMSVIESRVGELPAGERILVVCLSGSRSARVTAALIDAGYDAINVSGGMVAWQAAGGDIVTSNVDAPQA